MQFAVTYRFPTEALLVELAIYMCSPRAYVYISCCDRPCCGLASESAPFQPHRDSPPSLTPLQRDADEDQGPYDWNTFWAALSALVTLLSVSVGACGFVIRICREGRDVRRKEEEVGPLLQSPATASHASAAALHASHCQCVMSLVPCICKGAAVFARVDFCGAATRLDANVTAHRHPDIHLIRYS